MRKGRLLAILSIISITGFLLSSQGAAARGNAEFSSDIQFLFVVGMIVSLGLGLFVLVSLAYFLFRYRENTSAVRKRIKNEMKLEIAWTLVALALVTVAFILTVPVLSNIVSTPVDGKYETVMIEASQFSWRAYYQTFPNTSLATDVVNDTLNKYPGFPFVSKPTFPGDYAFTRIYLKAGQTYLLNVTATDVIHSFYSFDLSFKIDAVPGSFNLFKLKILEPGTYGFKCAEFCGSGHYQMYGEIMAY